MRRFLNSKVKVKVHCRARLTHIEQKSYCVNGDFVKQIGKRDCLARSLRHPDNLAVSCKVYKLHKNNIKSALVQVKSSQNALHSCNVSVVVSTPNVNSLVKASCNKLVSVISNISGKICRIAVFTDKHVVLQFKLVDFLLSLALFLEHLCLNFDVLVPKCTVLFIGKTLIGKVIYAVLDVAAFMKRALHKPSVIIYTVLRHIFTHFVNVKRKSELNKSLSSLLFGLVNKFVAVLLTELLCPLDYILAVIAVLGKLNGIFALYELLITNIKRKTELFNLISCVIYIEFSLDLIACHFKHARKTIAQCAASCVAHMHRTCGVCRYKFHVVFLALTVIASAVFFIERLNIKQNIGIKAAAKSEIYKACACNRALRKICSVKVYILCDYIGNFPRCVTESSCSCESYVCRVISVRPVLRHLNDKIG